MSILDSTKIFSGADLSSSHRFISNMQCKIFLNNRDNFKYLDNIAIHFFFSDFRFFDYDYLSDPYLRNSRQISQYSSNFQCQSEGTFPDSRNCRIFYR